MLALRRHGVRRSSGGPVLRARALARERDDDGADESQSETDTGHDDVPARSAEALVEERDPEQDSDDRVRDRDRGDGRGELARAERDLLEDEPQDARDGERIRFPVGEQLVDPRVEVVERRLRQRRREAEQDSRQRSVHGGLERQASSPTEGTITPSQPKAA